MIFGAMLIPTTLGSIMFLIGTPVSGLAVWTRGSDDGGDDDSERPPEVPPIDWGEFERSFWTHVRHHGGAPQRRPAASCG